MAADLATTGLTWTAALLIGLVGSLHCAGMCGGIVGAFGCGLGGLRAARVAVHLLAYNGGRIASYTLAGAAAGGAAAALGGGLEALGALPRVGRLVAALFMVGLGLYLAGWTRVLAPVERLGTVLWRRIEPLGRGLLPVTRPWQSLALGLVWGWLPCGLVYSVLVLAMTTASAAAGAGVMLAFGLGTLPMLLALGGTARALGPGLRLPWLRRAAGALVVLLGLTGLAAPLLWETHQGTATVGAGFP